ncbi:hypothetical protein IW139_000601 [Coemansia sp. RSA 353]|nr:hypothetical protein IW142_001334 [Coemansia sp. RSA 564]KAJ2301151.1 hypothetical protein IW139_000601 [Coemansia sp. RSA 353]
MYELLLFVFTAILLKASAGVTVLAKRKKCRGMLADELEFAGEEAHKCIDCSEDGNDITAMECAMDGDNNYMLLLCREDWLKMLGL